MHPTSGRSILYLDEQTHQWRKRTPPGWLVLASSVAKQPVAGQHAQRLDSSKPSNCASSTASLYSTLEYWFCNLIIINVTINP